MCIQRQTNGPDKIKCLAVFLQCDPETESL